MPERNGMEAAIYIRDMEKRKHSQGVPIIGLSGFEAEDIRSCCIDAGMNQVLSKPIKKHDIVTILNRYCPRNMSPS